MGGDERTPRWVRALRTNVARALRAGDLEAARRELEVLRREDPVSLETRGLELDLRSRAGDEEAEALARQLLELHPASPRIRFLAGQLAYRRRRWEEAEEHLGESLRLHDHPRTRRLWAKALTQLGRFDEAERELSSLVRRDPHCHRDLAWLHERQGRLGEALEEVARHLVHFPDDELVRAQRQRLEARRLAPEELEEEVRTRTDFGEELPSELAPEHLGNLLGQGRRREGREFVAALGSEPARDLATRLGWVAYQHGDWWLATGLFLRALPDRLEDYKLLNALEAAALRCGLHEDLVARYEELATAGERRLWGRARAVRRRAAEEEAEGG